MTANISSIDLYKLLREKIGEMEAQALTDYVERHVEKKFEDAKSTLVTKDEFQKAVADIRVEIRETKAEMIKWMFLFWIGNIGATIGIVLVFLKK